MALLVISWQPEQPAAGAARRHPPALILEMLTAVDARHAWMMLATGWRSGGSYLYATDDGGATWSKIARFRTGLPPPRD